MLSVSPSQIIVALAVIVRVQATFYVTAPFPPTKCYANTPCTVSWFNSDSDPVNDNVGLCAVSLHSAEDQTLVQGLNTINIDQDTSFEFNPLPYAGPPGEYYVNFTSLQPVGEPPSYFEMFSPYFEIDNLSGTVTVNLQPTSTAQAQAPGFSSMINWQGGSGSSSGSTLVSMAGFSLGTTVWFSNGQQIFPSSTSSSVAAASVSTSPSVAPAFAETGLSSASGATVLSVPPASVSAPSDPQPSSSDSGFASPSGSGSALGDNASSSAVSLRLDGFVGPSFALAGVVVACFAV